MSTPSKVLMMPALAHESLSLEEIEFALDRVIRSPAFNKSARMQRFLKCVVDHSLAGRDDQLKEYQVGVQVFDRPLDFEPLLDPIVRVEARRLRAKLDTYYRTIGRTDEVVIDVPKGAYKVRFRRRTPVRSGPVPAPVTVTLMPFTSAKPDGEWAAKALTWKVGHQLVRVHRIEVNPWYLNRSAVEASAQEEEPAFVLSALVDWNAARARAIVQWADRSTGKCLWSAEIDCVHRDSAAAQQELANAVAAAFAAQFARRNGPAVQACV